MADKQHQAEILLRGRLNGAQWNKLKRLLYMEYKPSELAEVLSISANQIYQVYVPGGCPHRRDENGRLWIVGSHFREWYIENYKKRKVGRGEAFCRACHKVITMQNPERKEADGLAYYLCTCPDCGNQTARIIGRKRKEQA